MLQAQITERMRAVRDEQQRADAAVQKLEALAPDGAQPDARPLARWRRRAVAAVVAGAVVAGVVVAAVAEDGG